MTVKNPISQVPVLDLAPKLKRPLSIWNPLDYLLLLYWVFYFPKAIDWYLETYCEPAPKKDLLSWRQRWESIKESPRKNHLILIALLIQIVFPLLVCFVLQNLYIPINWYKVTFDSIGSAAFSICFSGIIGVITGVEFGIAFGITLGIVFAVCWGFALGITFSLSIGFIFGIAIGSAIGLMGGMSATVTFGIVAGSVLGVLFGIGIDGTAFGLAFCVLGSTIIGLICTMAYSTVVLHPEHKPFTFKSILGITPLVYSQLIDEVEYWLELDWEQGLLNINQILKYSLQFIPFNKAFEKVFNKLDSNLLVARISSTSDLDYGYQVISYLILRDLSYQAIIKGFWYLHLFEEYRSLFFAHRYFDLEESKILQYIESEEDITLNLSRIDDEIPTKEYIRLILISRSLENFSKEREVSYGEEMYCLVFALNEFFLAKDIDGLINIPVTINQYSTNTTDLLRRSTWQTIDKLTESLLEIRIVRRSKSPNARSFALNRALGYINEVLEYLEALPPQVSRVEKPILKDISTRWRDILLKEASTIGQVEIDKPIANPYTIGDPVIGERFIGREDILRQLEELWFINTSPQSVILYGHRRMGKTSILRNATTKVNSEVRVAYVNLLSVSSASNGITDILMAICDALEEITEIPVPSNNDLHQFPETTFRRYLEQITKTFTGKGLIIALDEFEKIEELIDAGKLSKDFLGFLRGMVQMSSKLAFAFAGLHTLQEMNADYFQPFYASFIPISVAFLTRDATHQVLANPDPEFLLEYEPAALDHIYDLTNGQPYLTQLIGFQLVRLFNDYVFEQGKPRDRTFTIDDVHTVCSGENFFNTGINYFNGVWQQSAEGAAHQQDILKALAPLPQGLTESELISQTNLPSATLQAALKALKDHDVIRNQKTNEIVNWAITVELFRNWVVKYKA